jgi:hypothetical protein
MPKGSADGLFGKPPPLPGQKGHNAAASQRLMNDTQDMERRLSKLRLSLQAYSSARPSASVSTEPSRTRWNNANNARGLRSSKVGTGTSAAGKQSRSSRTSRDSKGNLEEQSNARTSYRPHKSLHVAAVGGHECRGGGVQEVAPSRSVGSEKPNHDKPVSRWSVSAHIVPHYDTVTLLTPSSWTGPRHSGLAGEARPRAIWASIQRK